LLNCIAESLIVVVCAVCITGLGCFSYNWVDC